MCAIVKRRLMYAVVHVSECSEKSESFVSRIVAVLKKLRSIK